MVCQQPIKNVGLYIGTGKGRACALDVEGRNEKLINIRIVLIAGNSLEYTTMKILLKITKHGKPYMPYERRKGYVLAAARSIGRGTLRVDVRSVWRKISEKFRHIR